MAKAGANGKSEGNRNGAGDGNGAAKGNGGGEEEIRARSLWSGTLTFGLVSIPVNLFPAHRSTRVSLRMLSPEGTPLSRRYYDPGTGRELDRRDLIRGFPIGDGYVPVSDEELDSLAPEKSREVDLRRFVPREQLDPLYFRRAYYLTPGGPSNKAYRLLARVMERTGRAGIATFVMRGTEYLVAILAENGILRAETLRFPEQVRSPADVGLEELPEAPGERVDALVSAIRSATEEALDEDELRDRESERILALVEEKRERDEGVVAPSGGTPAGESVEDGEDDDVIDLMEVLRRSLGGDGEAAGAGGSDREALEERTKDELYRRAQELDIEGRSRMTKDELIRAIRRTA